MISIRRASLADAAAIGAVHVAAWRSAYAGILPDTYLTHLSPTRLALHYKAAIATGTTVMVAAAAGAGPRIVGFTTASGPRIGPAGGLGVGAGEVETLYVLDDFRDQGIGRDLLRAAAGQLAQQKCRSLFVWVLRDNPSRWFYRHMGGQPAAEGQTRVAGVAVPQVAPIAGIRSIGCWPRPRLARRKAFGTHPVHPGACKRPPSCQRFRRGGRGSCRRR